MLRYVFEGMRSDYKAHSCTILPTLLSRALLGGASQRPSCNPDLYWDMPKEVSSHRNCTGDDTDGHAPPIAYVEICV